VRKLEQSLPSVPPHLLIFTSKTFYLRTMLSNPTSGENLFHVVNTSIENLESYKRSFAIHRNTFFLSSEGFYQSPAACWSKWCYHQGENPECELPVSTFTCVLVQTVITWHVSQEKCKTQNSDEVYFSKIGSTRMKTLITTS